MKAEKFIAYIYAYTDYYLQRNLAQEEIDQTDKESHIVSGNFLVYMYLFNNMVMPGSCVFFWSKH